MIFGIIAKVKTKLDKNSTSVLETEPNIIFVSCNSVFTVSNIVIKNKQDANFPIGLLNNDWYFVVIV